MPAVALHVERVDGAWTYLRSGCNALLAAPLDVLHGLQSDVRVERHPLVLQRAPARTAYTKVVTRAGTRFETSENHARGCEQLCKR